MSQSLRNNKYSKPSDEHKLRKSKSVALCPALPLDESYLQKTINHIFLIHKQILTVTCRHSVLNNVIDKCVILITKFIPKADFDRYKK